ncbi:MAG: HAD hydrolase-like protein [Akkermansiaceae bacterium]
MNLFFDLDGTISDPFQGITTSMNYALKKCEVKERDPAQLAKYIGPSLQFAFSELLETDDDEQLTRAIGFFRERYISVGFGENELYPNIVETLSKLREAGHRLFIVTSKREDIAVSVIQHFSLQDYFEKIYGCDVDLSKSDLITKILGEKDIDPNDTLMIGDRKFDIEAGKVNGLKTIGVLWGYGSKGELEYAGADYITANIIDLLTLLQSL